MTKRVEVNEQQKFDLEQKQKNHQTVEVDLEVFSGPLEALYNLVLKHQIEIFEISLTEVTEQFLKFTKNNPTMELSGDFVELTTRLIYLKSASILKMNREVEREMELEREEEEIAKQLLLRLQEYKKYKDASVNLSKMFEPVTKSYFKNRPEIVIREVFDLTCVTKENLYKALLELVTLELAREKSEKLVALSNSKLKMIYKDKFLTVEQKIGKIEDMLEIKHIRNFNELITKNNKMDKIVTFLALLEMSKSKQVHLYQEKAYEDLLIEKKIGRKDESDDPQ